MSIVDRLGLSSEQIEQHKDIIVSEKILVISNEMRQNCVFPTRKYVTFEAYLATAGIHFIVSE